MFKLPDFPSVDFSKFDLDAIRDFDFSKFDFSKYVPTVNFPNVDMPADLPTIDVDKFTAAVRDTAYLTVGIGAAAFEQAQARSRDFATTIADGLEATKIQIDTIVDRIEAILPDAAATLFGQVREMTDAAGNQVLGLFRNAA
jgi:hypothetical protein